MTAHTGSHEDPGHTGGLRNGAHPVGRRAPWLAHDQEHSNCGGTPLAWNEGESVWDGGCAPDPHAFSPSNLNAPTEMECTPHDALN
jgi:hypothetical protein